MSSLLRRSGNTASAGRPAGRSFPSKAGCATRTVRVRRKGISPLLLLRLDERSGSGFLAAVEQGVFVGRRQLSDRRPADRRRADRGDAELLVEHVPATRPATAKLLRRRSRNTGCRRLSGTSWRAASGRPSATAKTSPCGRSCTGLTRTPCCTAGRRRCSFTCPPGHRACSRLSAWKFSPWTSRPSVCSSSGPASESAASSRSAKSRSKCRVSTTRCGLAARNSGLAVGDRGRAGHGELHARTAPPAAFRYSVTTAVPLTLTISMLAPCPTTS